MTQIELLQFLLVVAGGLLALVTLLWRFECAMRKTDRITHDAILEARDEDRDEEIRHAISIGMIAGRVAAQEENVVFLDDHKTNGFVRPRGCQLN